MKPIKPIQLDQKAKNLKYVIFTKGKLNFDHKIEQ